MTPQAFITQIAPAAQSLYRKSGIFASVTIAQAAQETGWGKFIPTDKDTGKVSYNLFGVKGKGPAGHVNCPTWEVYNGIKKSKPDNFRAYHNYEESIADHQVLLLTARYAPVRKAATPEEAAEQLYRCGYATDPEYPAALKSIIKD